MAKVLKQFWQKWQKFARSGHTAQNRKFTVFLKKMGQPRPLFHLFTVFSNKHYNFYNKYMWKNVHPVYGAGIRTHNLWNMSLLP